MISMPPKALHQKLEMKFVQIKSYLYPFIAQALDFCISQILRKIALVQLYV